MPAFKVRMRAWTEFRANTGPETRWYDNDDVFSFNRVITTTSFANAQVRADEEVEMLTRFLESGLERARKVGGVRQYQTRAKAFLEKLVVLRDRRGRFLPAPPPRVKRSQAKKSRRTA